MIARLVLVLAALGAAAPAHGDPLPVPAVELTVKDHPIEPISPKQRAFKMRSGTKQELFVHIVPPAIGSAGDPTLDGGALTIFSVDGPLQSATYVLPAAGASRRRPSRRSRRTMRPSASPD